MNVFQVFTQHVRTAVETLAKAGAVPATLDLSRIVVEPPRDASMATWRPMRRWCWPKTPARSRASWPRRSPQKLAPLPEVAKVEIAGPGFINLTLEPDGLA